jgi:hypothetical protein
VRGVSVALQRGPRQIGGRRESAQLAVAIYEETLLHLVEHLVLEVLWRLSLQELEAEGMDRSDEHLGEASHPSERLAAACDDPFLQLCGCFVGERKRNDVAWGEAIAFSRREQVHDPPCNNLGLA